MYPIILTISLPSRDYRHINFGKHHSQGAEILLAALHNDRVWMRDGMA